MAKDKDKITASAQKFVQRGQIDKAIKEFQKALTLDKKDVKVHLRLGDLFSKKKDKENAIKYYCEAAKYYTKDGFYSKAVAVYKQALQLEETRTEVIFNLADLYHKLGLINDAMTQYQTVATHYERDGMIKEAIETIRRMAELDPRNVIVLTKLAELYYKNGMKEEGYGIFRRALDELKDAGRVEEYTRLLEKMAKADPDNNQNLKELCTIYLKRGVFDRAYKVLARIYKNDPEDLDSLQNLAQTCIKLKRNDEAVELLKALAAKYKSQALNQKAKDALRKVLQIKPDDRDALRVLGSEAAPRPEPKPEPEEEPQLLEEEVESGPVEALEELPEDEVMIEEPPTAREEGGKLTEDQILEHLTEAEVYLKYGLKDKAVHHVQTVLKSAPDNLSAHQRLKDIQLDSGETKKAISTLYRISELAKNQNDLRAARESLQQILELDSGQSQAQQLLDSLAAPVEEKRPVEKAVVLEEPEVVEEAEEELPAPEVVSEEMVTEEEEEIPEVIEEEEIPLEPKAKEAPVRAEEARDFHEDLEEAEFYIQQGLEDEAIKIYLEILKQDPTHEESLRRLQELGAMEEEAEEAAPGRIELAPEEEEEVAVEEEEVVEEEVVEEEAPAIDEKAPLEFKEEEEGPVVEEEEVIVEEEAPVSFELETPPPEPAAAKAPPAPSVRAEVEAPAALESQPEVTTLEIEPPSPAPPQAQAPAEEAPEVGEFIPPELGEGEALFGAEAGDEGLFDLAAELEQEDFGPAPGVEGKFSTAEKFSFEDMFSSFKKGVAKQVSEEDSSTHYDLGIAYKEMGLLDDAISEFQIALSGKGNPSDCHLMIGLCYQEKGQQEQAIETYQKGLAIPGLTNKEAVVFYYELGISHLSMGEREQARGMLEKAQAMDPGFRDVKEKLEEIAKEAPPPAPPPEAPAPPTPSREQVTWETAALNDAESEASAEPVSGEEEKKKPGKKKKISYV
jgi:pilus assembly protein FimV